MIQIPNTFNKEHTNNRHSSLNFFSESNRHKLHLCYAFALYRLKKQFVINISPVDLGICSLLIFQFFEPTWQS